MRKLERQVKRSVASSVSCLERVALAFDALADLVEVAILSHTFTVTSAVISRPTPTVDVDEAV